MKEEPYCDSMPNGLCFARNRYIRQCNPGLLSQKKVGTLCTYLLSTVGYLLAEVGTIAMKKRRSVLDPVNLTFAAGIVGLIIGASLVCVSGQSHLQVVASSDDVANRQASDQSNRGLGNSSSEFLIWRENIPEQSKQLPRS